jgi:MFS family permease
MLSTNPTEVPGQRRLFWACFIALTATSFAFIIRIMVLQNSPDFAAKFNLTDTQVGEIIGAGIWPFGVSIVLFSLVIDRIGYGKAIAFAFVGHSAFGLLTIFAEGYWALYTAALCSGLASGAVEAAINPIVATIFRREKTKWLNILHAGWPAGFVAAGLISIAMGPDMGWAAKVALIFLPVLAYGGLMLTCRFPVTERVRAGVTHLDMLKQVGLFGALIAVTLIVLEVSRTYGVDVWDGGTGTFTVAAVVLVLAGAFGIYTRSLGRPLFVLLTLVMMPLAITELGVDGWITELMSAELKAAGADPLWLLVYTMCIMMGLRFCAGPIVHRLSPLGLLSVSSGLAVLGLAALSAADALGLAFAAATIYALGKTFFWPTMLGVVSEQCPRGGALTLNLISGVGMLSAGVIGSQLLGYALDTQTSRRVLASNPAVHARLLGEEKNSMFGAYRPLDGRKRQALAAAEPGAAAEVDRIENGAKKDLLLWWTVFPGAMLVAYLALILYFKSRGGYRPVELLDAEAAAVT